MVLGCTALVAGGEGRTGEDGSVDLATEGGSTLAGEDGTLVDVLLHLGLAMVDECKGASSS